jgi:tetratricopeptide (TPR) repeat protein
LAGIDEPLSKRDDAEAEYRQAIALGASAAVYCALGSLLLNEHKRDEGMQAIHLASHLPISTNRDILFLGQCYVSSGLIDRALGLYRKALRRHTNDAELHAAVGQATAARADDIPVTRRVLRAKGLPGAAIREYRIAMALDHDNASIRLDFGDLLHGHGMLDDAKEIYEATVRIAPHWVEPYLRLATLSEGPNGYKKALWYDKAAISQDSDDESAYPQHGIDFYHERHYTGADAELKESLRLKPLDSRARDVLKKTCDRQAAQQELCLSPA